MLDSHWTLPSYRIPADTSNKRSFELWRAYRLYYKLLSCSTLLRADIESCICYMIVYLLYDLENALIFIIRHAAKCSVVL